MSPKTGDDTQEKNGAGLMALFHLWRGTWADRVAVIALIVALLSPIFATEIPVALLDGILYRSGLHRLFTGGFEETGLVLLYTVFFAVIPVIAAVLAVLSPWYISELLTKEAKIGASLLAAAAIGLLNYNVQSRSMNSAPVVDAVNYFRGDWQLGPRGSRLLSGGIQIYGPIMDSSVTEFERLVAENPDAKTVYLYGRGGRAAPARRLRDVIRAQGLDTFVNSECFGACTIVFMGGLQRYVSENARFGFSAPSVLGLREHSIEQVLRDDAARFGIDPEFMDVAYATIKNVSFQPQGLLRSHIATHLLAPGEEPLR